MDQDFPVNDDLDLDTMLLSKVVFALNIARHHIATYPPEHPVIATSLDKFLNYLGELLEFREELTIGVARDTLLIGAGILERKNAVYRDLAEKLFAADVAALTLHRALSAGELQTFLGALARKPEELRAAGGISSLLQDAGVRHLRIRELDYSPFVATEVAAFSGPAAGEEEQSDLVWVSFIDGLVANRFDGEGSAPAGELHIDPERLAQLLNMRGKRGEQDPGGDYDSTITEYLKQLDREEVNSRARRDSFAKLAAFIQRLDPEVRRQFLGSTFRSLAERDALAGEVLSSLSGDLLLDWLDEVEDPQLSVPPLIVNLLGKLAGHAGPDSEARRVATRRTFSEEDLKGRIRSLFSEDRSGQFLSADYQSLLQTALATDTETDLDSSMVEELMETLDGHALETRLCSIILEMVDADPLCDDAGVLLTNLVDLINYFRETGDFEALLVTHERLSRHFDESEPFSVPLARETLAAFQAPEFISETLLAIHFWGKEKYEAIRLLIGQIGKPFIEPLLDELASEGNMALRQYYLKILGDLGPTVRDAAIARLQDQRWYVVRNLLILLRSLKDPAVLKPIGHLFSHPHPQVQLEVMKTYLHFGDPRATRYLLKELESSDLKRRHNAVLLARRCHDRQIIHRILDLLEDGISERDFELKRAAVKTLAEIGDPVALPRLEGLLEKKSLLHPILYRRLKLEIVRSLPAYPAASTGRLLQRLAVSGQSELAAAALAQQRTLAREVRS